MVICLTHEDSIGGRGGGYELGRRGWEGGNWWSTTRRGGEGPKFVSFSRVGPKEPLIFDIKL